MDLPSITDAFVCEPGCPNCGGTGHVCEAHPDMPWEGVHPLGCSCGAAGMPCRPELRGGE